VTDLSTRPLRLVADANIPLVEAAFAPFGAVTALPAAALTRAAVADADVLLVRSVTRVDAVLLDGSAVRFVGTATIGTDHVDTAYLAARGIAFAHAPGSNAESVVEWVLAALLAVAADRGEALAGRTVALVGGGNVGGRLAPRLEALGLTVLRVDPPRARAEGPAGFVVLDEALARADIVSLHVPLVREGPDATHHLIDRARLAAMRPGAWLVNAARGGVVEGGALRQALETDALGAALLDVFEGEPAPDPALVARCALATPHIAGHSYDGKVGGTRMLHDALRRWRGQPGAFDETALMMAPEDRHPLEPGPPSASPEAETAWLDVLVRPLYHIRADDARLRTCMTAPDRAACFTALRAQYPRRRRWGLYRLDPARVPPRLHRAVFEGLGLAAATMP
jgi:erythronate-4-phosphate dehydrogenase